MHGSKADAKLCRLNYPRRLAGQSGQSPMDETSIPTTFAVVLERHAILKPDRQQCTALLPSLSSWVHVVSKDVFKSIKLS